MSVFHQIARHTGQVKRVPNGEAPVVEMHLEPSQYVVDFKLREVPDYTGARVTTDWAWEAFIVSPLP